MAKVKNKEQKLTIVSDIDGVVAEFTRNATIMMKELFGRPEEPVQTVNMTSWGFESLGISSQEEDVFWQRVSDSEHYWLDQQELYPGIVKRFADLLDAQTAIYWCTNKTHTKGATAETQTFLWLQKYGFPNPCVVVSNDKGYFCKSVAADFFIDDKASNVLDVISESPDTTCFYLVHKYGEEHVDEVKGKGAIIVRDTNDFVEMIKLKKTFGQFMPVGNATCCQ
jgi:hypothetical protein